ncbi:YIP1 family protein [Nocardiopsis quinghaiensis]|uniref:YIP1 family protein n=1 Tax=Nocardiopsis quinghaiensis TaxID=464995 RepID=UPI0012383EAB|nr:YIP1 family protein [Nocardiopsis quinghaiensis]
MLHHLVGLLVGVALAPVLWIAVAWSADLVPRIAGGDVTVATVLSVVVLCLVGAVCAYLVASRVSPLVAGAGGALLAALCLWPVVHAASMGTALSWLNEDSFLYPSGTGLAVALPLGTLLLFSAMTPLRWRAAHGTDTPSGGRGAAGADREGYRRAAREADPSDAPWEGAGGDTVPEAVPDRPPPPAPGGGFEDDPDKTTTPFRRGAGGAVWTPLDDEQEGTRAPRGRWR